MKKHPGSRSLSSNRLALGMILATAVALSFIGCESPLHSDSAGGSAALGVQTGDRYTQSLLARAVFHDNYGDPMGTSTINKGVHEMPRIDQQGPGSIAAAEPSDSSTNLSYKTVSTIGLAPATLNMPEPTANLSLQDTIALTAKHSLAVKFESYNPAIRESIIVQNESIFDPVIFGSTQWANTDDPAIQTPTFTNGTTWQNQIGVKRLLPTGAEVSTAVNINYRDIDTTGMDKLTIAGLNGLASSYQTNISFNVSQPLLRGFGTAVNEANIYLAQRDFRISLSDFKKQVMTSIADVEEAYWNLVSARTNVEILERLVIATGQTYNLVMARAELDATKAAIGQVKNALDSRKAELVLAQATYRQASDKLKSLINDPELPVRSNILINPTDRPVTEPMLYSTADCIETALRQRPELQSIRFQIEKTDINVGVAKNGLLPKLDLVAGLQVNGQDSKLDQAFSMAVDPLNSIDFSAGIKLEIPIGNRLAEATLKQRENERRQQIVNLAANVESVIDDVKNQLRTVLTAYEEMQHYDDARLAAAQYVQGILDIEEIRQKSPEFLLTKLDSQRQLADSEQNLTQATIAYNLAIMRLEQAKGTLLEFNRVSLQRPPRPPADNDNDFMRFMGRSLPVTR